MAATPVPSTALVSPAVAQTYLLDQAVENLKDRAATAQSDYSNDGDLSQLVNDLGYLRDRADAIQSVALRTIDALAGL